MFNLFLNQQTVVLIVSFIEIAAPLLSTNASGTQTSSRLCVVKLGEREETRQPQAALNGVTLTQRMTLHSSAPPHFFCCRVPRTSSTHAECHSRRMTGFTNAVPFPLSTDLAVKTASPLPGQPGSAGVPAFPPALKIHLPHTFVQSHSHKNKRPCLSLSSCDLHSAGSSAVPQSSSQLSLRSLLSLAK